MKTIAFGACVAPSSMLATGEKPIVDFEILYGETAPELMNKIMEVVQKTLRRPEVQSACIEEVKPVTPEEMKAWNDQFMADLSILPSVQLRGIMERTQVVAHEAARRLKIKKLLSIEERHPHDEY